ncbi:MAG TPA: hypothetical protein V6C72_18800 [Chroococcales cyanobacterium]
MTTKNERLGLLLATVIFAIIGCAQLWRGFANIPVQFNGNAIPDWISFVAGSVALVMAFWMNRIMRHHRPMI